jgi:ADP-heptose:LPS heptosyltransferase
MILSIVEKQPHLEKKILNMKVAIFVPNRHQFGNILTQIPMLCAIKKEYPNAEIDIWSKVKQSSILTEVINVNELIIYKKYNLIRLIKELNTKNYDAIYNLYAGSDKVHLSIKLCNASNTFGHSSKPIHRFCYKKHLIIRKGAQYIANTHLSLFNYANATNYQCSILGDINPHYNAAPTGLTLLPGGGAGEYKRWPIESFMAVAKEIASKKVTSIESINWILGPDESHYAKLIPDHINDIKVNVYQSPNVKTLVEIAQSSALTIGNDCGPTHVFQMLDIPIITLWGRENDERHPVSAIPEWFNSREHAWALFPNEKGRTIQTISISKVFSLAFAELKYHR